MANIMELVQTGVAKKLAERGIHSPELVASQIMSRAQVADNSLTIEGKSIDVYLDEFCATGTNNNANAGNQEPAWQAPTVEEALGDITIYETWMAKDEGGCLEAFRKYNDGQMKAFGHT